RQRHLAARSNAGVDQPVGRPVLATDRRRASSEIIQLPGRGPPCSLALSLAPLFGSGSPRNAVSRDRAQAVAQGPVSAGATFTLTPGSGGRVAFPRSNLGTFSLDIGTVETQTVNGIGGDDSFTISDLTGVADLTAVYFNGGAGNNTPAGCCQ